MKRSLPLTALFLFCFLAGVALAQSALSITVNKTPYCGCCKQWMAHLQANGFTVSGKDVDDTAPVRASLGMPAKLGSCHTAVINGYVIEGHVPAEDIKRLLKEKPKALGLSVPGMPLGSPGMESANPQPYETLLVMKDGSTKLWAKH
jgi:hypothetical protein